MVLWRKPVITAPAHKGIAMPRFIDSCVVGVNVYGSRPSRLIVSSSTISDVNIRAHLCPALFSGIISCFVISWKNHSWRVERRLVIHRLPGVGSNRVGNSNESRIKGIPKRHGLVNWSKKLKFMVRFKERVWWLLVFCWKGG